MNTVNLKIFVTVYFLQICIKENIGKVLNYGNDSLVMVHWIAKDRKSFVSNFIFANLHS